MNVVTVVNSLEIGRHLSLFVFSIGFNLNTSINKQEIHHQVEIRSMKLFTLYS